MADYVGALDQGTTSTRFMIFDHSGSVVGVDQKEHEQIYPKPGWVEHDPKEIWQRSQEVTDGALKKAGIGASDLAAVGITNQRETAVVWDRNTGEPVYNALVWQDTRQQDIVDSLSADGGQDRFREKTGLPLATYFSGTKVRWILDNVEGARARAEAGDLVFGNIDTLVHLEPHRRDQRRRARDRRHERQSHDAHEPGDARLGRRPAARRSGSPGRCCPRSGRRPRCTARRRERSRASRWRATSATSRRPRSVRPPTTSATRRTRTARATS